MNKESTPQNPTWMSYAEWKFTTSFMDLQMRYYPWPVPKDEVEKLEKEFEEVEKLTKV